ncbi:DUF2917 domain-containing protein [Denitromonas ohlonensis]|uniref:DUF2917 domain-containing protein n=2 Tax=Denitromonas TaxID=139331 RepID=A0A557RTJ0_9RHOO|nr:DUF2917 domain-containing protein [Denitromonas ohlonensis]TVO68476.1 DUF2917 domain-containing protein [Denitromonas ohlonensis]TVO74754.1 DUF2917 domain-containing protein [Denitromonas ohlonensis]
MAEVIACETVTLTPRTTLVLAQMAYAEVSCQAGGVWITQYGDHRDVLLKPGQSVVLDLPTATVMTASDGAEVLITRRPVPAQRPSFARWLVGLFDPRWSSRASCAVRQYMRSLPQH